MSECIQNSDQPTSNLTFPPQLLRSSSAGSSSSFDSCSDLLGSLEHADESLDDSLERAHAQHELKCGEVGDDSCHQALDMSDSVALNQCENTTEEQGLPYVTPFEVKDDGIKMEALSMKDHVYGLSTAISFSKVRSLAENTVERISQLQTSFRLSTSYIFPSKHVVPIHNTLPPLDTDAKMVTSTEASSSCEAHTVDGTETLGDAFDGKLNTERACLIDTSPLLPKELGNAEHVLCGDSNDKSCHSVLSHVMHTDGFSSQEVVAVAEEITKMGDGANPLMGNVCAFGSTPVIVGTSDVSSKVLLGNDCMLAGDSLPVVGITDISINDGFGKTSMFAGHSLPLKGTDNMSTQDTVGDTSAFAGDSMPVAGTNNVCTKDESVNNGMRFGDSTGSNISMKDAFSNNSMLAGDSMRASDVSTIDVSGNDSMLRFKLVAGPHDMLTVDAFSRRSKLFDKNEDAGLAEAQKELLLDSDFKMTQNLDQLMTLSQNPKLSELDVVATSEESQKAGGDVIEDVLCLPDYTKQVVVGDSDLQQLENTIISFDLHKKNSATCHPLGTFSSGSGRPDLEEDDDEQGIALYNKHSFNWNSASTKSGVLSNRQPLELLDSAPNSANTLSSVESHARVDHEVYMPKGNRWLSSLDHETIPKDNQSSLSFGEQRVQVVGSSALSSRSEGREFLWNGRPVLVEAVEGLGCRHNCSSDEQSCGEILHEERWKGLSVRLESEVYSDKKEEKEHLGPDELFRYVENLELNEAYVDTILDMEDVLLNYDEDGSRERFLLASSNSVIGTPRSSRDGSLSSSTSGLQLLTSGECIPFTVDWVEVVGAKQRKGGSSLGERIVGVKDHTVYCIKVSSGSQEWEVFRRYRDFVDLYHQLRRKFNVRTERSLPSPWKEVDRDSRKVFGSTHPNIIEVRSSRIEKCLQSLLQAGPPLSTSSPLYWFLCPQSTAKGFSVHGGPNSMLSVASQKGLDVQLGMIESPYLQSPRSEVGSHKGELDSDRSALVLGKTVKLNLKIHPNKNLKQLLSAQHHSCAGCYKHLELERGLVQGFVQTLGWGKPRLCEYSGQLYCASCHLNETAVLPAQVLWHWDFTPRRVSQLAKAYLDSIYDQPMLCVSAVNPYLYSRVPTLSHVRETRRKLSKMLSCMVCPSRSRIFQTMASRWYLLENNDFFALRDLEDVSKGAFAVLPGLLTAVMESLRLHITKQCSVCAEMGEWCGAGVVCEEPFSPIFPFQDENIDRCKVCHAPFHKVCFSRYTSCPACPKDQSKRSGLVGEFANTLTEELADDHRNVLPLLDGQDLRASSSLAGVIDLQGRINSDKVSHSPRTWPSFYSLLPKNRLW